MDAAPACPPARAEFPSTCWYTAQKLTDLLTLGGGTAPPLGLMAVPVGGTMLEDWAEWDAQLPAAGCHNVTCSASRW